MRQTIRTCCTGLALLAAAAASAGVSCTPTNNTIAFGPYDPLAGTALSGNGSFQVVCVDTAGGGSTNLTWFASASNSGTGQRQLASGAERLNYDLFTDANHLFRWGDGSGSTSQLSGTMTVPKNSSVTSGAVPYYGLITGGQDVAGRDSLGSTPLTYSQLLTITITCQKSNGQPLAC